MASQSLLLGALGRTRCASTESLDFQTRLGRPPVGDPGGPAPGVLVLTRAADREVDELSLRLAVRGVPMLRLDSDRSAGLELTWDALDGVVETPDVRFAPRTVWLRHFSGASVPSQGMNGVDDYVREQWVAWSRMVLAGARSVVVNGSANGTANLSATDRVAQLAAARQVGLRVPATVVTSRPGSAADRIPGHGDLMVKSLGDPFVEPVPGCLRTVFPRRLSRAELAAVRAVEPAPVMVQEFVPSSRRLRMYAVGGELIGFELGARPEAPRGGAEQGSAEQGSVTPVPVPDELRAQLKVLAGRWGMDVAAIDLLDTADGPVFLQVTAACQWLRLERAAGVSTVTDAVAGLLEKNFHSAG